MSYRTIGVLFVLVYGLLSALPAATFHHTGDFPAQNIENDQNAASTRAIGPRDFPPGVNPLTGLPVDDPTLLERHPVIAKISNAPPLVRPQAGIGTADLVYEHYAEGGLTRFSAVYHGQYPERVGSIRSARIIDYELMPMYDGLLAYSGASIGVEDMLNTSEFVERLYKGVLYGRPYYWRDETIPIPHNMFTNVAALGNLAVETPRTKALEGMAFDPLPPDDADGEATLIDLRYRATRVRWEYDDDSGLYRRFADNQPHFDANTNQQVTAANVVIIYASHRLTDIVESEWQGSLSFSIEIELWFDGDAVLFRDGQRYDGRWVRPTRESLLGLRTVDDEMLYLKPGNTWFQVVRLPDQQEPLEEWLNVE